VVLPQRHARLDIGHCDTGPWHIVARGLPVAFIDWTLAGPTDRRDEVAATGWWNAQLHDDDIAEANHRADAVTRGAQLRQFLDGYGLPAAEGAGLVTHMIEFAIRDCAWEAIRAQVTPESTDPTPLWALAWRARAAAWRFATDRPCNTPSSPTHRRPDRPAAAHDEYRAGRPYHPAWLPGQAWIAAAGGADRRSAKNASAGMNQPREAHLAERSLHSPKGTELERCWRAGDAGGTPPARVGTSVGTRVRVAPPGWAG
jgi:hypothetical protein